MMTTKRKWKAYEQKKALKAMTPPFYQWTKECDEEHITYYLTTCLINVQKVAYRDHILADNKLRIRLFSNEIRRNASFKYCEGEFFHNFNIWNDCCKLKDDVKFISEQQNRLLPKLERCMFNAIQRASNNYESMIDLDTQELSSLLDQQDAFVKTCKTINKKAEETIGTFYDFIKEREYV